MRERLHSTHFQNLDTSWTRAHGFENVIFELLGALFSNQSALIASFVFQDK
jgi:hypothetical protein